MICTGTNIFTFCPISSYISYFCVWLFSSKKMGAHQYFASFVINDYSLNIISELLQRKPKLLHVLRDWTEIPANTQLNQERLIWKCAKHTQAHHGVGVVPHGAVHITGASASIHRILQYLTVAHSVEPVNLLVICRYFMEYGHGQLFFFVESGRFCRI